MKKSEILRKVKSEISAEMRKPGFLCCHLGRISLFSDDDETAINCNELTDRVRLKINFFPTLLCYLRAERMDLDWLYDDSVTTYRCNEIRIAMLNEMIGEYERIGE